MDGALGAVVGDLPFGVRVDGQRAAAVVFLAGVDKAGVQRCGRGDELEDRARVIQFGHALVFPLRFTQVPLQRGVFVLAEDAVLGDGQRGVLAQAGDQQVDLLGGQLFVVQDGGQLLVLDRVGVVGVELVDRRHREDRAGVDIHHNDRAAVHDAVLVHGLGKILFNDRLHVFVDGQVQVIPVDRFVDLGVGGVDLVAERVLHADAAPRRTGQNIVVGAFQPVHAVAVGVGKAEHRGKEGVVRVAAGGALLGIDIENGVPFLLGRAGGQGAFGVGVFQDRILGGQVHPAGQDLILAVPVAELFQDALARDRAVQQLADLVGGFGNEGLVAAGGVGDDVPHRCAAGQHLAGGGIDRAAGRGEHLVRKLLFGRADAVALGVAQLQRIELVDQQPHAEQDEHRHQQQRAHAQRVVDGVAAVFGAPFAGMRGFVLVHGLGLSWGIQNIPPGRQTAVQQKKRAPGRMHASGRLRRKARRSARVTGQSCRAG